MSATATELNTRLPTEGTVTRLNRPRERQTPLAVVGVLLVAGCALAAVLLARSGQRTVDVVVAAHDLAPGQAISAGDVRVTAVPTSTNARFLPASRLSEITGKVPRGYVPTGTPLNAGMLAAGNAVPAGQEVVGAVLPAGAMPAGGLQPGDAVEVLIVSKSAGGVAAPPADAGSAQVWAVAPASTNATTGTTGTWVSLRASTSLALKIAQAASDSTLRLAVVGSQG